MADSGSPRIAHAENGPRADIKERQRTGEYEQVLTEYAQRYKKVLQVGDQYMASNFFEEMFSTAVRLVNKEKPDLSAKEQLKGIRDRLDQLVRQVGANEEFMDQFERNFDLCTIKFLPGEAARRLRREQQETKEGKGA